LSLYKGIRIIVVKCKLRGGVKKEIWFCSVVGYNSWTIQKEKKGRRRKGGEPPKTVSIGDWIVI
jgi:hypothetical protein